jgi:hypothetical protein
MGGGWWRSNKGTYTCKSKRVRIEKARKLEFVDVGPRSKQTMVCFLAKVREQDVDKK